MYSQRMIGPFPGPLEDFFALPGKSDLDKGMNNDIEGIIADELLIVRDSGEIPEVALHGSLYYLCHDPEGPGLTLCEEEISALKMMAVKRYQEIISRDLNPDNRELPLYRGPARCLANWRRYCLFCEREGIEVDMDFRRRTAEAMITFLCCEIEECGEKPSAVNCGPDEIIELASLLGLDREHLPEGWEKLCCGDPNCP